MEKRDYSLLDVLQLLKVRWWIVALAAIMLAGAAGVYSWMSYVPTYSTNVSVIANNTAAAQQDVSVGEEYNQVNMALKEIRTYMELLKAYDFMEQISDTYKERFPEAWEEQPYTATRLSTKCFEFTITEDTYLFYVTITTNNKEASYNLGKIFEELAPQRISSMYNGRDSIAIYDHARVPALASNSKNMARNTMMGFLIGAVLSFLIVLVVDVLDIRIKTEEDVIDNYTIPLLGSVPNFETARKKGYGYGKK